MDEQINLEKIQEEARKRLDPDNSLTLKEPQAVGSMISKAATMAIAKCPRTPEQITAEAESAERRRRIAMWQMLAKQIGDRYANCHLSKWIYHGSAQFQVNQREVVSQATKYAHQIPERVQAGSGIVLLGPPGTGKDFIVSALMRTAILQFGIGVEWVNGVDLFARFRDAISGDTSEKKLVSQWTAPSILAISDPLPPRGDLTEFQTAMLFRIVDARYRANRPTWVTINVEDRGEAGRRMGPQVISRMAEGAMTCRCEWPDFREGKWK